MKVFNKKIEFEIPNELDANGISIQEPNSENLKN
tara:strand:+ start:568 stop:669 length:102 start_codon:yes stop_codon:yes gene_type:complete